MLGEAGQNSRERRLARPVSSFPARIFCRGDVRKSVINEQDFVRNAAHAQADLLEEMPFGFSAAHLCGLEDPVNVLGEPKNLQSGRWLSYAPGSSPGSTSRSAGQDRARWGAVSDGLNSSQPLLETPSGPGDGIF